MLKKQHWAYRILVSKHTYVYTSILIGLILSHPNLPWASVTVGLCMSCCAMASTIGFLTERNSKLKSLLSFEQVKVVLKDKEIQEAIRRKKEAQFILRKSLQSPVEAQKDLPLAARAKVLQLPVGLSHLERFVQRESFPK